MRGSPTIYPAIASTLSPESGSPAKARLIFGTFDGAMVIFASGKFCAVATSSSRPGFSSACARALTDSRVLTGTDVFGDVAAHSRSHWRAFSLSPPNPSTSSLQGSVHIDVRGNDVPSL